MLIVKWFLRIIFGVAFFRPSAVLARSYLALVAGLAVARRDLHGLRDSGR
jgi:hypothetical protein